MSLSKEIYDLIFQDYFEKRIHSSELAKKYGVKEAKIKYEMYKSNFTQASYLRFKYSKEYLEKELLENTFEELSKKLNLSLGELRVLIKNHNIKKDIKTFRLKYKVNPDFYLNKKYEKEFYYFVGLLVTDGYIVNKNSCKIVIKNKGSKELLQSLSNVIGHGIVKSLKNDFYCLTLTDSCLITKLQEIGVPLKNKTYLLKDVYIPNKDCFLSYLAGILDGDGSVKFIKNKFNKGTTLTYKLCNYNIEFLLNLQQKIKNFLSLESSVYTGKKEKNEIPSLCVGVKQGSHFLFHSIYKTSPLYLKCKYQRYLNVINNVMI